MSSNFRKPASFSGPLLGTIIASIALASPPLYAQQLEEIVVTAQRREQSLQEVPISVEVYSGLDLSSQGLGIMDELAAYSPSVEITTDVIRYNISIRGMGSNGPNLGMEQSAATFVDGVHFGRGSMSYGAYLDLERLEILRGPQPVHFGQNATAGAFSLTTKKPGAEWEGDITAEVGSMGRKNAEGGIGGPISDTLGVRVAGKIGRYDGFLTDIVTGQKFPSREDNAGRVTMMWSPTDNFTATLSATIQQIETEGDAHALCQDKFLPALNEFATFIPGRVPAWDAIKNQEPLPDCVEDGFTKVGRMAGDGTPYSPVAGIRQSDQQFGFIDATDLWPEIFAETGIRGMFYMNAKNYRLGLDYELDNGVIVELNTGIIDYFRQTFEDTSAAPIMANAASRTEIFDMLSQELRVRSVAGGAIEWEVGGYFQKEDIDGDPSCESRPGVRHPQRCNYLWQDSEWKNVFASLTFNFLDNKASIDVGARHSWVDKEASIRGTGQTWIFDINPDPDNNGTVLTDNGTRNIAFAIINCATGNPQCGNYGAGYWTHIWGEGIPSNRRVPDEWHLQKPVALGPEVVGIRNDEGYDEDGNPVFSFHDTFSTTSLDPQVVLRYRPNDDLSLYAKWVRSFKSGGFDTASRAIPDSLEKFTYGNEDAEAFEVGLKGSAMDNRVMYGVSAFRQRMYGLQQETNDPISGSDITQAGLQQTKGIEFDAAWAVSERLTANLVGAIMKGTLIEFPDAGCTDVEFEDAENNPCYSQAESIAEFGDGRQTGIIDRSGYTAPRTPDWKFTVGLDYWHPLTDNIKAVLDTNIAYSDEYIFDVEGYSEIVKWDKHVDWNMNAGFGSTDDDWRVTFYARNILNARVKYFPENDVFPSNELSGAHKMTASQYFNYGIQLRYLYN